MDRDRHPNIDEHSGRQSKEGEPGGSPVEGQAEESKGRRRRNRYHTGRRKGRGKPASRDQRQSRDETGEQSTPENLARMQGARASGRTPGISTAEEPATVPLGTDDEAAGTAPAARAIEQEIDRAEQGRGMQGLTAEEAMRGRPGHPEHPSRAFAKIAAIAAVLALVIIVVALLL